MPEKQLWMFIKTFVNNKVGGVQDVHVFLSSVKKKLRILMKTFQNFSPYNVFCMVLYTHRHTQTIII